VIGLLAAPALPLHSAGKYVAGAYVVFVVVLLIYLGIMAIRLGHTRRELAELKREVEQDQAVEHDRPRDLERVGAGRLTRPPEGEPGWRAEA
jgi:hypothetical protein